MNPQSLPKIIGFALMATWFLASSNAGAGVSYLDPASGWRYTYEGTLDPGVEDAGFVGGVGPAGYGPTDRSGGLDGTWKHDQGGGSWDGTAPGDPLSDPTLPVGSNGPEGTSPGGIGASVEAGTTYIHMQDAGNPEAHGWCHGGDPPCKGPDVPPDVTKHPVNTNRRLWFGHNLQDDGTLVGDEELFINTTGVTFSFRGRIPVTGPLDDIYSEEDINPADGSLDVIPWSQDSPNGRGIPMLDNRGMFNLIQNDPLFGDRDYSVSFALVTSTDITAFCAGAPAGASLCDSSHSGSGGLIMNNLNGSVPSSLISSESPGTLNIVEISDADLNDWNEFWITAKGPINPFGIVEVNVYMNGSTAPVGTFDVTLTNSNNAAYADDQDPFIEFGMRDTTYYGSLDLDFMSYQLGVIVPEAAPEPDADFDNDGDVDGADFLLWQRGGSPNPLSGSDLAAWQADFGSVAPQTAASTAVPEPSSLVLAGALLILSGLAPISFGFDKRTGSEEE